MKIALVNTYPSGGAGLACRRLQQALQRAGHDVPLVSASDLGSRWPFYAERLSFLPFERDKSVRFAFSLANYGKNLAAHPDIRSADIIHLHWINQGLLDLAHFEALQALGKPIVWTLHDMWAFTGGCHYSRGCTHYKAFCGRCPYLRFRHPNDLSHLIWMRKRKYYPHSLTIVTCSEWLAGLASQSSLLAEHTVQAIPNPIDTDFFKPFTAQERLDWRLSLEIGPDTSVLLFSAMNTAEKRKGFHLLVEALKLYKQRFPESHLTCVVMGKADPEALTALPYPVKALGLVKDAQILAAAYAAADAFVIPSLEDNLPNTVMESLSCGTPVAGFNTGGIPEMIQHTRQGYIAAQGDTADLADGIHWVLNHPDPEALRREARGKALTAYAEAVVAEQYIKLYKLL